MIADHRGKLFLLVLIGLGLAALLLSQRAQDALGPDTPRTQVANAWTKAGDIGRYQFRTKVVQTLHPTLTLDNVGRTARTEQIIIQGEMDKPAEQMLLNMQLPNQPGLELKIANGETLGRVDGDSEWAEIDTSADLFAPGGDPLGFLAAAENITAVSDQLATDAAADTFFPTGMLPVALADSITRYQFDMNGPQYARFMRTEMETMLRERGELPAGLTLQDAQVYLDMQGSGEIWVSAGGLPVRQIMHLEFPAEAGARDWVSAEITTSFTDWDQRNAEGLAFDWQRPIASISNLLANIHIAPETATQIGSTLFIFSGALGFAGVLLHFQRSPKLRVAINLTLVVGILAPPFLTVQRANAAEAAQAAWHQQQSEAINPDAEAESESATDLLRKNVKPFENPLSGTYAASIAFAAADSATDVSSPTAYVLDSVLSTTCVITATSDCDGDGLTDNVEIYELGTWIDDVDTDDDNISDWAEVTGFGAGGQTWYLDPRKTDTNGDGISDGIECIYRTNVITSTINTEFDLYPCEDEDEDGNPDVFDYDNDGDGVPDSADLNPNQYQEVSNQEFGLTLAGAETGKSIFFDLQIRPTDDRHLWWTNSVMDWPDDDKLGQITRVTTATLTTDGDMVLTPMLEITIPYSDTNPTRGLPKLAAVNINDITATTPITTWLNIETLDKYQISVSQDSVGQLSVYVPLIVAQDRVDQGAVAWGARMLYELDPGAAGWGAAHQMRLLWLVTGLIDQCIPPDGTEDVAAYCNETGNWISTQTVIQTYPDDFVVTGFNIQENLGTEALIVAQKPGASGSTLYDSQLWHMADTLEDVFLRSQIVTDTVPHRFTLSDVATQAPNWSIPAADIAMQTFTGLEDEVALVEALDGDTVPDFLNTIHISPLAPLTTTVLILSEEVRRSRSMGAADSIILPSDEITFTQKVIFTNNTFEVDFTGAVSETYGSLHVRPYGYNGAMWVDGQLAPFLEGIAADLDSVFTTEVLTGTLGVAPEDAARARTGAVRIAQLYYTSLFETFSGRLAVGEVAVFGDPYVAADHLRPVEPLASMVNHMVTKVQAYYGRLNLGDFVVPAVDPATTVKSASAWAALANSRGAVLVAFGDVINGGAMRSTSQALLELNYLPDTVTNDDLLDMNAFVAMYYSTVITGKRFLEIPLYLVSGAFLASRATGSVRSTIIFYNRWQKVEAAAAAGNNELVRSRKLLDSLLANPNPGQGSLDLIISTKERIRLADSARLPLVNVQLRAAIQGTVIVVVTAAFAIAFSLLSGTGADSPAFSRLLARQIAGIIVEVIKNLLRIAFVAATAGLGLFVLALIELVDLAMTLTCAALGLDNEDYGVGTSDPDLWGRWFCGGITGALVEALSYVINDTTPLVDFARGERLDVVFHRPRVANLIGREGMLVGNEVTLTATVTTTLYSDAPNWMGYLYPWQWADEFLDDASFEYKIQDNEDDIDVDLNGMSWLDVPGKAPENVFIEEGARFFATATPSGSHIFTEPGINRELPLNFLEGFATQMQNCWLFPGPPPYWVVPVCWLSEFDHTNATAVAFNFDVLPATLDGFHRLVQTDVSANGETSYRQGWDTTFPTLADADGDGLRSTAVGINGNDPNDSNPDSDGDGLNDYFEIAHAGYDATVADSDCDGLGDYWEAFYGTRPDLADTDHDGLLDSEEVFHPNQGNPYKNSAESNANPSTCALDLGQTARYEGGWEIVYGFDGATPLTFRVTSDPLDADSDDDGLSDKQEQVYGYNPNVATRLNVLSLESAVQTSSGHYPYVSPTGSVTYTAIISNELSARYARGLLEAELPLDNVLRTQPTGIVQPLQTVTMTGAIAVSEAGLNTSQATQMGIRAGAIIDDETGRVLWLHMNEPTSSTTFVDASYHGHDALCEGSACPTANSSELAFDGIDDRVTVADHPDFDLTNFTVALRVKPTEIPSPFAYPVLVAKGDFSSAYPNFELSLNPGSTHVIYAVYDACTGGGNRRNGISIDSMPLNEWTHITFTYDGARLVLYFDGIEQSSLAYAGIPCQNNIPITFGDADFLTLDTNFQGSLDEFEIYPQALDTATIQQRYGEPTLDVDLRDSSTWGAVGVSCPSGRCPTTSGDGTSFNQKQHLTAPAVDLSGDAFTFATWVKPADRTYPFAVTHSNAISLTEDNKWPDADYQGVFGYQDTSNNKTIYPSLYIGDNGKLRFIMGDGTETCEVSSVADGLVALDEWQHIVVTHDGTTLTFYVNGQAISGGTIGTCAPVAPPSVSTMNIGRPNEYGYVWFDRIDFFSRSDEGSSGHGAEDRLNWNSDYEAGNVYEYNVDFPPPGDKPLNLYDLRILDGSNSWFRWWENDSGDNGAYERPFFFPDDNRVQVTGIQNTNRLGPQATAWDTGLSNWPDSGTVYWQVSNDFFQGQVESLQVYQYTLGSLAVADLYQSTGTALELRLDEAPGATVFADTSGNTVTAACAGTTCPTSGVSGRHNQALDFDGVDDFLTLSGSELGIGGSFTAMMWVKPDDYLVNNGRVALIGDNNYRFLGWSGYGYPTMRYQAEGGGNSLYGQNRWIHLAYVYEAVNGSTGTYSFYVDGQQLLIDWGIGTLYPSLTGPAFGLGPEITIGKTANGLYFDGRLDDVTILPRVLTAAEIQAAMAEAPVVNLHLDEDLDSGIFVDDTQFGNNATCTNCPGAGDKGQIRESAVFSNSLLTVSNSSNMTFTNFTVGMWVKPTGVLNDSQPLITKEADDGNNRTFGLFIKPDSMQVHYSVQQADCATWVSGDSTGSLFENQWNHVLMTYDGTQTAVYINGALQGSQAYSGALCQNANPIKIGSENNVYLPYSGGLDEIAVYAQALDGSQVASLYNYQVAWYDIIDRHDIIVDADDPRVDLSHIPAIISAQETVMVIGATDPTSYVASVSYQVDGGAWLAATADQDTWLFAFPPSTPGTHTLVAQATDVVGNATTSDPVVITVDGAAPSLIIDPQSGVQQASSAITVTGSADDALSGVDYSTLQVIVRDRLGTAVVGSSQTVFSGANWESSQALTTPPYGVYTITASALDQAGNAATALTTRQLDGLPPYADVVTDVIAINPVVPPTFAGVVSDIPYPTDSRMLHLHFEAGPGVFFDGSKNNMTATCSSCPATGVSGVQGDAVSFDGASYLDLQANTIVTTTASDQLGLDETSFTVLAWVQASDWSGDLAILGTSPITSSEGLYVGIQNGSPILGYGGDDSVMTGTISTDEWVHLVWRYDQPTGERTFFINGTQVMTPTVGHATISGNDAVQIGRARGGNGYAGLLDELVVYAQALSAETIYDIANPLAVGIADMQARFRPFEGTVGQPETISSVGGNWNPVTVASNNSNYTSWQVAMPGDLAMGPYKLDLLVTDGVSNTTFVEGAWSGTMIAPNLTLSKTTVVTETAVNQVIPYSLTYTNSGNVPATGVVLTETIPADTFFNPTASAAGWDCLPAVGTPGATCTILVGDLTPGDSGVISFSLTVTDTLTPGTVAVVNTTQIDADSGHIVTTETYWATYLGGPPCPPVNPNCILWIIPHYFDSDEADNSSSATTPMSGGPDLHVVKSDGGITATVGSDQVFTYTITYSNTGSQAAIAQLIETIPPYVSSTYANFLSGWVCPDISEGNCTYDLGVVAPGASGSVPFEAIMWTQMPDVAVLTNTVTITDVAGAGDLNPLDNTYTITTPWEFNFGTTITNPIVTVTEGSVATNYGDVIPVSEFSAWFVQSDVGVVTNDYDNYAWSWTYTTTDGTDESQLVSIIIGDDAGNVITNTFQLVVENVPPTLLITGTDTAIAGSLYTLTLGDVFDPGPDTITACTIDWGDSENTDCLSTVTGGGPDPIHIYGAGLFNRTIAVILTDEDGDHTAVTKNVYVDTATGAITTFTEEVFVDETAAIAVVTVTGRYGPLESPHSLSVSEGAVTDHADGTWTWSSDSSLGAESSRDVIVTISGSGTDTAVFNMTVTGDGVDGPIEDGAPNSGDGNADAIPDRQQGHVTSLPGFGGAYVTVETNAARALRNVTYSDSLPSGTPADLAFPLGYLAYDIEQISTEGAVVVTLWLTDTSGINTVYQYGPTHNDNSDHWYAFKYDAATGTGAKIMADRIVITYVDGQRGDHDLAANGAVTTATAPAYKLPSFTLTTEINGLGTVSPASGSYLAGTAIALTAIPGVGWSFSGWTEAITGTNPTQNVTMNANKLVVANFTRNKYTLTTAFVGSGVMAINPIKSTYYYGDQVTVSVTPATGWVFAGWSGSLGGSDTTESLTITGDATVTATFNPIPYTINVMPTSNGSVTLAPDQASYIYGDTVVITAQADTGWEIDSWTGGTSGLPVDNTVLVIDSNKTVTATFKTATYTIAIDVLGNGLVTVDPQQSSYAHGDVVTVTAAADLGWSFVAWLEGVTGSATVETITMDSDKYILAQFSQNQYALALTWIGQGNVTSTPAGSSFTYGEAVTLTATADEHHHFVGWEGDVSSTEPIVTLTMDAARVVTATFAQIPYTLTLNIVGSGSVTLTVAIDSEGTITPTVTTISTTIGYGGGDVAVLTAVAPVGWQFDGWTGAEVGASAIISFTMDISKVITATFSDNSVPTAVSMKTGVAGGAGALPWVTTAFALFLGIVSAVWMRRRRIEIGGFCTWPRKGSIQS